MYDVQYVEVFSIEDTHGGFFQKESNGYLPFYQFFEKVLGDPKIGTQWNLL